MPWPGPFTRPLLAITETMREITSTHDLARKIELRGWWIDEDATVFASTFNRLTDSIARFQREATSKERLSALGRMSTVIAHEIRNPLMIIKASLRSFRRPELNHDVREAADDIDHEVIRLNRIVGDVLDFARPLKLDLHPTDLNAVCRQAAEAVAIDVEDSAPRLELSLESALLHGPEQIADLPVPVAESPGAVRIGHPERSHLVEYLAPNSVFNSLPRQRSSPHLRPDDRLVTIDRVLHHASLGVA